METGLLVSQMTDIQKKRSQLKSQQIARKLRQGKMPTSEEISPFVRKHLSDDDIAECVDAFVMFDFHSEGVVPTTSLGTILRALGLNPTDWEILDYIEQFDEDETDCLELTEVLKIYAMRTADEVLEHNDGHLSFRALDTDASGYIEQDELNRTCAGTSAWGPPIACGAESHEQAVAGDAAMTTVCFQHVL